MKTRIIPLTTLFIAVVLLAASCRSSREGCPSTRFSGERYKATKFRWE